MKIELPLHDATFDGAITGRTSTTLYFTGTDGKGLSVVLESVDALQMEDFREGNIVILFEITTGEEPDPSINWERLFPSPHPSAKEDYHAQYASVLGSKISAVADGRLTLIEMQPAYGADLLAVCEKVIPQGL